MLPAIVFALVGLVIGPWLGIVVDRFVDAEPLEPEHRCPDCRAGLGRQSLVPVLGWTQKCSNGYRSWRYPLVDLSTAGAFAAAGYVFEFSAPVWVYLFAFISMVAMSVIDVETHLLLDRLTKPTALVTAFSILLLSGMLGREDHIGPAFVGGAALTLVLFVVYRVYPPGLGFGDVKLAPTLGLLVGWLGVDAFEAVSLSLYVLLIAMTSLAILGFALRFITKSKGELPLGPFLSMATVLVIVLSGPGLPSTLAV